MRKTEGLAIADLVLSQMAIGPRVFLDWHRSCDRVLSMANQLEMPQTTYLKGN
jgi:hypothetical protein